MQKWKTGVSSLKRPFLKKHWYKRRLIARSINQYLHPNQPTNRPMASLSKQEYLKKYLEKVKKGKKKRQKESKTSFPSRLKILDKNIDLNSIDFDVKEIDDAEDAPVVAEIIDERPLEVKVRELYKSSQWKKVGSLEGSEEENCLVEKSFKNHSSSDCNVVKETSKRRNRHDSDSDASLSKICHLGSHKKHSDSDILPPRSDSKNVKRQRQSDSDISPPRSDHNNIKKEKRSDSDTSPPRSYHKSTKKERLKYSHKNVSSLTHPPNRDNKLKHSDSDSSPPRNRLKEISPSHSFKSSKESKYSSSNNFLKKHKSRHDSESDSVDSFKINASKTSIKISNKHDQIHRKEDSDSDFSPPRAKSHHNNRNLQKEKKCEYDSDLSPVRRETIRSGTKSDERKSRPVKTLSGLKAGLQSATTLREETKELRERERKHIKKLNEELSGRNAETIIRDRQTGLKRNLEAENKVKEEEAKKLADQQKKYMEWGKGIEQTENKMKNIEEDLYEMSKPLARYCDDEDLEERLKSIIHDDDPMAEYIKKKRQKHMPSVPMYSGPPAPPNRFGIPPGYRWDGVDRSNGFEKKYFEKKNKTKALQEEAYLWSVQEM